ncbi:hypothetical protein C0995_000996 [Termitomyces sp. Mi166|nr:hypothetical protein C0995_000996 [Termitomyces sp. Mi166\
MLEKQLTISKSRCPRRPIHKRKRYDRRLPSLLDIKPSRTHISQPSYEFTAFCERLLLTNKIWKQERELKDLHAASQAKSRAQRSTAFTTFCEQLLLWNRIWKLEREAVELVREKERVQRERTAAVTRAAKRMVQDVQKERMVEEFVKDLIEEVETTKAEIGSTKKKHEREVEEIQGEWVKDYRRVRGELEQLKLAQSARLVEQELSNSMEESLFESLQEGKRRVEQLEKSLKVVSYASSDEATANEDEVSDVDSELVSDLSSTTCVSSRRSSTTTLDYIPERKRCMSQGSLLAPRTLRHSHSCSVPITVDASNLGTPAIDQGKSFTATSGSMTSITRISNHSGKPLAVRNRTTSVIVALRTPPTSSASGSTFAKNGSLADRAPWRV